MLSKVEFEDLYVDFNNIYVKATLVEPKQEEAQGRASGPRDFQKTDSEKLQKASAEAT